MSINPTPYHLQNMNRFFQETAIQTRDKIREEQRDYTKKRELYEEKKRFQEVIKDYEKEFPKLQRGIYENMNYSMLNVYADNLKIKQVDLQAHQFLVLRKEEFLELRIIKSARRCLPIREIKKQALPFLGLLSGMTLAFSFPFKGAIAASLVFGSGLCIYTGSGLAVMFTAHRLQEEEVDDRVISKANVEVLKGGMRFFKACQKVHQIKDRVKDDNSSFFNRLFLSISDGFWNRCLSTSSEESWIPSLAMNPSWKDRITKIEEKLQDLGEDTSTTQEEQRKVALLEELI